MNSQKVIVSMQTVDATLPGKAKSLPFSLENRIKKQSRFRFKIQRESCKQVTVDPCWAGVEPDFDAPCKPVPDHDLVYSSRHPDDATNEIEPNENPPDFKEIADYFDFLAEVGSLADGEIWLGDGTKVDYFPDVDLATWLAESDGTSRCALIDDEAMEVHSEIANETDSFEQLLDIFGSDLGDYDFM